MKALFCTGVALFLGVLCVGQHSQTGKDKITLFVIDLSSTDSYIGKNKTSDDDAEVELKYIAWHIDPNTPFKIELMDNTRDSTYLNRVNRIIQSPNSIDRHVLSSEDFEKSYSDNMNELGNNESLSFQIELDSVPGNKAEQRLVNKLIMVQISSSGGKPNDSFFILSVIKSISSVKPESEFFDLHAKFNYSDSWFSMLSIDFSTIDSGEDQNNILLEGMLNLNRYFGEGFDEKDRKFFLGAGMKIFDANSLYGLHIGSLEINGPFYSSYALIGYYGSLFKYTSNEIGGYHNIYIELALSVLSDRISMLNNMRVKVGYMQPLNRASAEIFAYRSRLVIEIPIGGIYRF